jgi:hypothetical protein
MHQCVVPVKNCPSHRLNELIKKWEQHQTPWNFILASSMSVYFIHSNIGWNRSRAIYILHGDMTWQRFCAQLERDSVPSSWNSQQNVTCLEQNLWRGEEIFRAILVAFNIHGSVHRSMNQYKYPTGCNLVIELTIPKFIEGWTCFERHTAHQELQTIFAASGVVTGRYRCPGWVGTEFSPSLCNSNGRSPHGYINQRLQIVWSSLWWAVCRAKHMRLQ